MAGGHSSELRVFDERPGRVVRGWVAGMAHYRGITQRWLRPQRYPMALRPRLFVHELDVGLLQAASTYKQIATQMAQRASTAQYGPIVFAHPQINAGAVWELRSRHGDGEALDNALLRRVCGLRNEVTSRITTDLVHPETELSHVIWGHSFGGLVATERAAMGATDLLIGVTPAGACEPPATAWEWVQWYAKLAKAGKLHPEYMGDSLSLDGRFVATALMNLPSATKSIGRLATRPAPQIDAVAGRTRTLAVVAPNDELIAAASQRRWAERVGASVIELPTNEVHNGFIFASPALRRVVDGVMDSLESAGLNEPLLSNDAVADIQSSIPTDTALSGRAQSLGLRLSGLVAGSQVGRPAS